MEKRRFFILFVFLSVSLVCFAEGEIGGSGIQISSTEYTIYGGGLNAAGIIYFNKIIGVGLFGNLMYIPADGVIAILTDSLIGGVFRFINGDSFSLPICVGLYGAYLYAFSDGGTAKGANIGPGVNITGQIKFGNGKYFYLRLQGAYGFLDNGEIFISPSIGIGF